MIITLIWWCVFLNDVRLIPSNHICHEIVNSAIILYAWNYHPNSYFIITTFHTLTKLVIAWELAIGIKTFTQTSLLLLFIHDDIYIAWKFSWIWWRSAGEFDDVISLIVFSFGLVPNSVTPSISNYDFFGSCLKIRDNFRDLLSGFALYNNHIFCDL